MHHISAPDNVATITELRAHGVTNHAITTRCRPSGPWQRVLPGVVLMSAARPTRRQRLRAAIAYAGPDSVVSGVDAMRAHGIDVPLLPDVLVLAPATRRLASRAYLTVERTTRPPRPTPHAGLPYAPLARAVLDAARRAADHEQLRVLLTSTIGPCTVGELRTELDAGSQRGSAAVRALLTPDLASADEVVPEEVTLARRLLRGTALPAPQWHVPVHDDVGMLLGVPDAWWPEVGLALDVGPRTRHHDPRAWLAAGRTLFRTDQHRLSTAPTAVMDELVAAFAAAAANGHRRAG
ncbi:hypothetical protein [Actinophytocola glycyrrhizae]|uniref:Transcriptional regulator, AbiEi antitoxin, Type IV TA system n=1 Tax=Actinophytocola glycyrrhizae TaxID=2044873 RepID=A0ABV9S7C7_9PSEU